MISMKGEIKNLGGVLVALCYCRLVCIRIPKGKWRLISIAPVIYLLAIVPLHISFSAFMTALSAFLFTWLAAFKLLLFAFDLGPLVSVPPKSLPVFVAVAALPFKLTTTAAPKKSKKLPLYLASEIPIAAVLVSVMHKYKDHMHPFLVLVAYCCLVFLMIEVVVELSSLLVRPLLGMELEPASDEPYLSASLQEFWGRRWNLTVNSILRDAVFQPVRSAATTAAVGRETAIVIGVLATFVVSGLMHELLFWYVSPVAPSWEMTGFFVVHGVCVVAEMGIKARFGRRKWRLPWFATGPATVGFVIVTSYWLFFPPLMRNGSDVRVIGELRFAGEIVMEKTKGVWGCARNWVHI